MQRVARDILTDPPPPPADERIAYGSEPLQFGDLRTPPDWTHDRLAVVLHGGAWKATYNLVHTGHLCVALRDAGIAAFNVEYRRAGDPRGGWPDSLHDVVRAVEHARGLAERLVLVGHSAGGHLGLLAAAETHVPIVALAAVCDPLTWENEAVALFFGREPPPDASPLRRLPLGVPHVLLHGTKDDVVPFEQSERYVAAAGGEAELIPLAGAGHFELIDPLSPECAIVQRTIARVLA